MEVFQWLVAIGVDGVPEHDNLSAIHCAAKLVPCLPFLFVSYTIVGLCGIHRVSS